MKDVDDRLMHCFGSVFPSAPSEEIQAVKFEEITGWDSLRGVTLLAVLEEEFGVQMDLPELLELETFEAVKQLLMQSGKIPQASE
jgi:acyl carrier protein